MTADPGQADQLGLFGPDPDSPPTPVPGPADRRKTSKPVPGGSPVSAVRVMQDIRDNRLGVLDTTERIVEFYGDDQVRLSPDEDVAASLLEQGYAAERGNRDRLTCRHGAIARPVTPLRLTPEGKRLLLRWSALVPFGPR